MSVLVKQDFIKIDNLYALNATIVVVPVNNKNIVTA